jgi:methionine sulfoxide reductase heme-binding subunit
MTTGPSPLWYATRATGVVALVLLTATVVLGVAGTARFATPGWPRMITAQLHRNLSLLAVLFVAAHVVTTVLDPFAPIGWISAVVPFVSPYRALWLSLGTVSFDMLLAVVVTSLLRARLSYGSWRAVHWLGYACWPVALWHGLGTGTDSKLPWLLALEAACVVAVALAAGWRLSLGRPRPGLATWLLACAAVPVATVVFVAVGPLQPGWARRAGTPVALMAGRAVPASATGPAAGASAAALADGSFSGRAARTRDAGDVTITVTAQTGASGQQGLVITLRGAPDGAGVTLTDGTVSVRPAGTASAYSGPVVQLDGHRLVADLRGPGGTAARAKITLFIRGARATGTLTIARGENQ